MGFDNECIKDIQSLKGDYFCPVCRHLVFPDKVLQTRCGHLYCKPCLSYVVQTTQACPCDGLLVSEIASKPLLESDKSLAHTIWQISVCCLYNKSGCMWEGSLAECVSHAHGCAFRNSLVTCTKCAVQIPHKDIPEHRKTCNVPPPKALQMPQFQQVTQSKTQHRSHSTSMGQPRGGFKPRPPFFRQQPPVRIPCGPLPQPLLPLQPPQRQRTSVQLQDEADLGRTRGSSHLEGVLPFGPMPWPMLPVQPPPWLKSTDVRNANVQPLPWPHQQPSLEERLKTVPSPLLPLEPPQRLYGGRMGGFPVQVPIDSGSRGLLPPQTALHQKTPMDTVISIKQPDSKKQKVSSYQSSTEKQESSRISDANGHDNNGKTHQWLAE